MAPSLRCNELVAKCSIKAWADPDLVNAQLQLERLSCRLHIQAAAESGVILYTTTAVVVSTLDDFGKPCSLVICAGCYFYIYFSDLLSEHQRPSMTSRHHTTMGFRQS